MAIRRLGASDIDFIRMRTMIANVVVCQMMPPGVVKGGSALKVRFGDSTTRATTDLDAARAIGLEEFVSEFAGRLATGWNGFTARLVPRKPANPAGVPPSYVMQPFEVKLDYLGGAWCTVNFELGHDEIGDADAPEMVMPIEVSHALESLGFPEPAPIPLMPLEHQIAQKLHGASEPGSMRAHDLIDLQLMVSRGVIDYPKARSICERLFRYRRAQAWPPTIIEQDGWSSIYAEQSLGLDVLPDITAAIIWSNDLVKRIASA